ncbi:MAG TPA: PilZ domain-containing protein [Gammaproteobacteria bacterium]|nr:PilZ domain-containing protein [Gammaproteobacteria bacterium]
MEQRWSTRTPIRLDVDVVYADRDMEDCATRDIGMGGVFLEMTDRLPPVDTMVELTFKVGPTDRRTRHKLKAKVVRASGDGVGLMFRDFDAGSFRALQEVLRYAQGVSAP